MTELGKESAMSDHYTREEIVKESFLFISYKHDDRNEVVQDVLDYLFEQGVRFWYDADLSYGDKWPEVAKKLINNENCRGVIFFNSEASFKSEPVFFERQFTVEKMKACKKNGEPFFIFPVNIGKPSAIRIVKGILDGLSDSDREIERELPLKYLKEIAELFDNETIYCYADPENKSGYMESLYQKIERDLPSVVSKAALELRKLQSANSSSSPTVTLGAFCDKPTDALPSALLGKNAAVSYNNTRYIVQDGQAYTERCLEWRVLYCEGEEFVLIADEPVDLRFGTELSAWLKGEFREIAFTEEERERVLDIRLLNRADIGHIESPELLKLAAGKRNPDGHWWIDDPVYGALQRVIRRDGTVSPSGYNVRTKKSGVRPVIVVTKDELLSLTQD